MYIVIFEGIATSGKSTVIRELAKALALYKVVIFGEPETHFPIKDDRTGLHLAFFQGLIQRFQQTNVDIVLVDRLYMTQAFRAAARMSDYVAIEQQLLNSGAETIVLEVGDTALADRLTAAMEHRDPAWGIYVQSKAESIQTVATMYAAQQYVLRQFVHDSLLPYKFYDTTGHGYAAITADICARLPLLNIDA
jgi:thymidylate kinase